MKAFGGFIFVVILVVPYTFDVWDDYDYICVVVAAVTLFKQRRLPKTPRSLLTQVKFLGSK